MEPTHWQPTLNHRLITRGFSFLLALPTYYQGKDIVVFRFIIEYSSLRDFYRPLVNRLSFICEDFWKMIFWLVLKLEISYNRVIIIISWRILVCFRRFFEHYIFCMVKYLSVNGKATVWQTHPLFCLLCLQNISQKLCSSNLCRHFIVALLTIVLDGAWQYLASRGDSSVRDIIFSSDICKVDNTITCFRKCR
jgi:hypothetical protein